ncbi:MAG: IS110 family transposase [Chitinophagaceae bacterium]|nr:IS110 family transposase [Chitinophagaceae bacterium]
METKKLCCGIDVSHSTLDVCYQNNLGELFHLQVGNNNQGFAKILEHTGVGYHFVMEATGVYYIRLAFYLHHRGCELSVVNAIAIKRYIQMHLERNKTDKKDAAWICRYAIEQQPAYWQMPDSAYFESKQLYNTIREYTEQIKRFHNQLHSLGLLPVPSRDTIKSIEKVIESMKKEIKQLEQKLQVLLEQWQPDQLKNVSSIKGIGKRAAAMLIVFTQGFKHTENHRQLISFAGLAPTQYSSGSSIQGKPRIYKRGGKNLRDVLYMCSMNAMKTNAACKALYERLRANGKTGKQALIAVCNKLLKQVFAVVKNNTMYQPNYCSAKP